MKRQEKVKQVLTHVDKDRFLTFLAKRNPIRFLNLYYEFSGIKDISEFNDFDSILINEAGYIAAIKKYRELIDSSLIDAVNYVKALKIRHNLWESN